MITGHHQIQYVALTLLLFGFSIGSCSHLPPRKYYFVNLAINWTNAQHYCREKYTDLATIESIDDVNRIQPSFSYSWMWIGLRDDPKSWKESMGKDTNSWRWSATGETSKTGYHNWDASQPDELTSHKVCVVMTPEGKWADCTCESFHHFICYSATNNKERTFMYISALKTWADALDYCRQYYTDMPMIESNEENSKVSSAMAASDQAWIGLYRVRWSWSDKSQSSYRFWRSSSPNNYGGKQFCVSQNTLNEWDDEECLTKYPFVCHQVSKLKTMMRIKTETDADITDPATNTQILQQLGAKLTSQGWTDFKLQWKIQPRKQEEEKLITPHCISHF